MNLIHALVVHKVFGEGEITSANEGRITVRFNADEKVFLYPEAFCKFLKFTDAELQKEYDAEQNTADAVKEEKKSEEIQIIPVNTGRKYTRQKLIERMAKGQSFSFHPFYGHKQTSPVSDSCFSNWYACTFCIDGITYHTVEQYMMSQKALLFHDPEIYKKILQEEDPKVCKKLGRQVRSFDSWIWNQHNYAIVRDGCLAKFLQNPEFAKVLLSTGEDVIVEAAPRDTIWGVGYGKNNEKIQDPSLWRGMNYLGFVLMEVRDELRKEKEVS